MSEKSPPTTMLFAGLRTGKTLILLDLATGERIEVNDDKICLGDFLEGLEKVRPPNNLRIQVQKDVAYVLNVKSKLVSVPGSQGNVKVFRNKSFADALYQGPFTRGYFTVKMRMLPEPRILSSQCTLHFEAVEPRLARKQLIHWISKSSRSSFSSTTSATYLPLPPTSSETLQQQISVISSTSSTFLPPVPKRNADKSAGQKAKMVMDLANHIQLEELKIVEVSKKKKKSMTKRKLGPESNHQQQEKKKKTKKTKNVEKTSEPINLKI